MLMWVDAPGGYLILLLVVAVLSVVAVISMGMARTVARVHAGDAQPTIAVLAPDPVAEVRYLEASAEALRRVHEGDDASRQGTPQFDWQDAEVVRRAAGVLLLDGDYDAAMAMLTRSARHGTVAIAADRASSGAMLEALRPALVAEWRALRAFWVRSNESTRGALFGSAEGDRKAACAEFLACGPDEVTLPGCASSLPERLVVPFVRNVHVRVVEASRAQDSLVGVVVGLGLPCRSTSSRLYWERLPDRMTPYDSLVTRVSENVEGG